MNGLGFLSPGLAAAAALAVAIPVLVHLFLRRNRRPVEWAAMDLLREALRRVERRRRVERILLLAVRCLLVTCAGLAVAAPFIGSGDVGARTARTLAVVIDDSSASAESIGGGSALSRSAASALEAIEQLGPGDRVSVVTTSAPERAADTPPSLDVAGAARLVRSLVPTELPCRMAPAVDAAVQALGREEALGSERTLLVASAFRSGTVRDFPALARPPEGTSVEVRATEIPGADGPNLRIASVEAERTIGSAETNAVRVVVERDRGEGILRTTLRVSGPTLTAPAERAVELSAGERSRAVVVPIPERPQGGQPSRRSVVASISGDAQPLDDSMAAVLSPNDRLRAVVVDRRSFDSGVGIDRLAPGEWVVRALAPGDQATIDALQVDPAALDARTVAAADAVVVAQAQALQPAQWSMLSAFVRRGGALVVMPAAAERPQPWTDALSREFGMPWKMGIEARDLPAGSQLAADQPGAAVVPALAPELPQLAAAVEFFRTVDVDASMDPGAVQLSRVDGSPFLLAWRPAGARGRVILLTSAIDVGWTTLPLKPLMVPLWQELLVECRRGASAALQASVGSRPEVDRPGVSELRPAAADGSPLPGARAVPVGAGGRTGLAVDRAGLLDMVDSSGSVVGMLAVSVDRPAASVAETDRGRVSAWLGSIGSFSWGGGAPGTAGGGVQASGAPGRSLAGPLLVAAIVLALAESFLARRFSHVVGASAAGGTA